MIKKVDLADSWLNLIIDEFHKGYMDDIKKMIIENKKKGIIIYPPSSKIFNAFKLTEFNLIKVVILGQDPYHQEGQAHGLSFSVPTNIPPPPSLINIYKELSVDMDSHFDNSNGNLDSWAKQGVFLLNTTLTVQKGKPLSHSKIGWNLFTDRVIEVISNNKEKVVFILWGMQAQSKKHLINETKHIILQSAHPSPLSAHRGFFGSKPFSKTNHYLESNDLKMIEWTNFDL